MNLELTGCHPNAGPGQGCPEGGCDYVALYDGSDESAPLLGKFSGQPSTLPVVVSSGQDLHIRFITDTSNCGIAAAGRVSCDSSCIGTFNSEGILFFDSEISTRIT